MSEFYYGAPGITAAVTSSNRTIFLQHSATYLAQGRLIDGTKSRDPGNTGDVGVLRAGLLMGKISAGNYAPAILGVTTNAEAVGSTSIEAAAGVITELVRRVGSSGTFKLTGPPTANGVVATETVTYSAASGTTITATAIVNAYVAGSFIQPTDGSETPLTFINDTDSGNGTKVVDSAGASISLVDMPKMPVSGIIKSSQLLPAWPSDTSLRAWITARLNDSFGGAFVFDHNY